MQKPKLATGLVLPGLVLLSVAAHAFSSGSFGFLIYETHTQAWQIDLGNIAVGAPKSYNVTVECKEEMGTFLVTYFLEITGPPALCNDYLTLTWQDTDGSHFTIGKNSDQTFTGTGTVRWNSSLPAPTEAGHKNNITLTLTFLTPAAAGSYRSKMWVTFTQQPVETQVAITPAALNPASRGQWITAYITLPKPYREKEIDINTVKLWHDDAFVPAEWGFQTRRVAVAKFPRTRVAGMLSAAHGTTQLTVTGLADDTPFTGTDTILVLNP